MTCCGQQAGAKAPEGRAVRAGQGRPRVGQVVSTAPGEAEGTRGSDTNQATLRLLPPAHTCRPCVPEGAGQRSAPSASGRVGPRRLHLLPLPPSHVPGGAASPARPPARSRLASGRRSSPRSPGHLETAEDATPPRQTFGNRSTPRLVGASRDLASPLPPRPLWPRPHPSDVLSIPRLQNPESAVFSF